MDELVDLHVEPDRPTRACDAARARRDDPLLAIAPAEYVELFTGELSYLHTGHSSYPLRPGHEWCGRVLAIGDGVDPAWLDRRVMGDTMLGDRVCRRCPVCGWPAFRSGYVRCYSTYC